MAQIWFEKITSLSPMYTKKSHIPPYKLTFSGNDVYAKTYFTLLDNFASVDVCMKWLHF